ncbi:MAG TPA: hydroxymethylbilane synthase [Chthoniobacterales bacterium]
MSAEAKGPDDRLERSLAEMVIGTRGSELAMTQARAVADALREKCGLQVKVEVIRTSGDEGDQVTDRRAGRKGLFTAELERALVQRRIDLAVHSAKDLPSQLHDGTRVAATLPRGPVEDLLIAKIPASIESLPFNARIATGSVRRQRQVRWIRPDVGLIDLRGNVPTRLRKFAANDWDAIILARAGLERLEFSFPEFELGKAKFFANILAAEKFLPAGGQGVIAVQTRAADETIARMISMIDDRQTHLCFRAEREFLKLMQADCDTPIGALAIAVSNKIELRAQIFADAIEPKMASGRGSSPEEIAAEVFSKINGT